MDIEKLKFPIGQYKKPEQYTLELISEWIKNIEELPAILRQVKRDALKKTCKKHIAQTGGIFNSLFTTLQTVI